MATYIRKQSEITEAFQWFPEVEFKGITNYYSEDKICISGFIKKVKGWDSNIDDWIYPGDYIIIDKNGDKHIIRKSIFEEKFEKLK